MHADCYNLLKHVWRRGEFSLGLDDSADFDQVLGDYLNGQSRLIHKSAGHGPVLAGSWSCGWDTGIMQQTYAWEAANEPVDPEKQPKGPPTHRDIATISQQLEWYLQSPYSTQFALRKPRLMRQALERDVVPFEI
jgi:hypothetical protein